MQVDASEWALVCWHWHDAKCKLQFSRIFNSVFGHDASKRC